MPLPHIDQRVALADKIRRHKSAVAEAVTDEFFARHPDWLTRFGPAGRARGVEDAGYHVEFLAGAVESGSVAAFQNYVRWTTKVLQTRGIQPHFVAENLAQVEQRLGAVLGAEDLAVVSAFILAGRENSPEESAVPNVSGAEGGLELTRQLFVQALLHAQRKAASTIALEAFRQGHAIPDIYADVIQNALYEVGFLWQTNRITVAEEHMATAIAQYVLAQLYPLLPLPDTSRGTVVVTGVEGELHQIGANMVSDVLEADGWRVHFLGTNTPHAGVLKIVEETRAAALGVSTTMLFNVPKVRRLIADARACFPARKLHVIVGGGAFCGAPTLPFEIGADSYASDLRAAVALLRSSDIGGN